MADFDDRAFRAALGQFCTGVVIATGTLDGEPAGFAAQSFSSLSLDPPLVMLCPAKSSTSWPKLRDSGAFCINILGEDQRAVCDLFEQSGLVDLEGKLIHNDRFLVVPNLGLPWSPYLTPSYLRGKCFCGFCSGYRFFVGLNLRWKHTLGPCQLRQEPCLNFAVLPEWFPLLGPLLT